MDDATTDIAQRATVDQVTVRSASIGAVNAQAGTPAVPDYLEKHYWWAYVRPWAIRLFERDWLANLILLGNYRGLRDRALDALGESLPGRTLQLACVYGNLTKQLQKRVCAGSGQLDVVDVLAAQLDNLRVKLADPAVQLLQRNSSMLGLSDASYDRVLMFFLLHEQPPDVRKQTLYEALRVLKPNGSLVIVDFARPPRWHPMRFLWLPILAQLEPFASDLWTEEITDWEPLTDPGLVWDRATVFGGLFQIILIKEARIYSLWS